MSLSLLPEPKQSYEDSNGRPLNGGKLYTYAAGTTTPKATYQDAAGTIPNTNPIILNERGEAIVYGTGNYRLVLKNAFDATIWDRDNVSTSVAGTDLSGSNGASLIGWDDTTLDVFIKNRLGRVADSIAQLRSLDKTKYTRAFVTGYYGAGDGGGGPYWLDPADTTSTDNGGTVIVASDGGRWKLQRTASISVKQFGAKGDNTTDDTAVVQVAVDWLYTLGGGELYFPEGTYLLTSVSRNFSASRSVNIRGAGKYATFLKKTGATTTPILNWSADTSVLSTYADFRDFSIVGNAKANYGLRITQCARFDIKNVDIGACDIAIDNVGSLVFSAHNITVHDNNVGYKCRRSSPGNIACNLVSVYDSQFVVNTVFAVDLDVASQVNFVGCDFEQNGTVGSPATGPVILRQGITAEFGYAMINLDNCWFESNSGTGIQNESTGNPAFFLSLRDCQSFVQEAGRVMVINSNAAFVLLDNLLAGTTGDTVNLACGRTDIRGGLIYTITDTSPVQNRQSEATSTGTRPFVAFGGTNGGLRMLSNGNVLVGPTAAIAGGSASLTVTQKSNTQTASVQVDGSAGTAFLFSTASTGGVGSITCSSTNTAYNTSSDYRLKQNVRPITDAWARMRMYRPCTYEFIAEPTVTVRGFLAHEFAEACPSGTTGKKDEMQTIDMLDSEGNVIGQQTVPKYQGIDPSKSIADIIATLLEAMDRIEALEAAKP